MVEIYTDGSSSPAPNTRGPIGWAYVVVRNGEPWFSDHGGAPAGTNNVAELTAAIRGLEALGKVYWQVPDGEEVVLVSDSRYVLGMATEKYAAASNLELIEQLRTLFKKFCTDKRWVRGHTGNPMNERCDRLAKMGRKAAATHSGVAPS